MFVGQVAQGMSEPGSTLLDRTHIGTHSGILTNHFETIALLRLNPVIADERVEVQEVRVVQLVMLVLAIQRVDASRLIRYRTSRRAECGEDDIP